MPWPEAIDYNEAIQNPAVCFLDPELKQGRPEVNALGWPLPYSGNFAVVYKVFGRDGTPWAVKCFTREVPGLRERYHAISVHLRRAKLPFTADFEYLQQGIRIHGNWYAVVKMRWVEGLTLNDFLKGQLDKPQVLERLSTLWLKLARELRRAGIAHADLQHGNVLLVPGGKSGVLSVRLIDYDGMYVLALADRSSGEVGHANYQHPERARRGVYDAEVDRFPHLVIYTALRALLCGGRALWERHDNGENLLFREQDFAAPAQSALFRELWQLPDPAVRGLATHLARACQGAVADVPLLGDLADTLDPAPAPSAFQKREAQALPETPLAGEAPARHALLASFQSGPAVFAVPFAESPTHTLPQERSARGLGIAFVALGCLALGFAFIAWLALSGGTTRVAEDPETPVAAAKSDTRAAEAERQMQQAFIAERQKADRRRPKKVEIVPIEEQLKREHEEAERQKQEILQREREEAERQTRAAAKKRQREETERQQREAVKREQEVAERRKQEAIKKRQRKEVEEKERVAAAERAAEEAEAARKLRYAKGFIDDSIAKARKGQFEESRQLLAVAQRRLREILDTHPMTMAAEDGKRLLERYSGQP